MLASIARVTAILLGCLLLSGGVGLLLYHNIEQEERAQLELETQHHLGNLQEDLDRELRHLTYAMAFITDQVRLHDPLGGVKNREVLVEDFLSFLNTYPYFDQLRLLDMSGREVIRANYNNGHPVNVAAGELQDKSNRYYFREGLKLKPNEVYLSPFDLNIEHGQVERPFKPTIRLVRPAIDPAGKQVGLVVVNVLGDVLLTHFRNESALTPAEHVSLLNANGYWLTGPRKEDLWGFMFGDRADRTMAKRLPGVWQQIDDAKEGRVVTDGGVYLFATFYPGSTFGRSADADIRRPEERVWKIVAYYSEGYLDAQLAGQRRIVIYGALAIGLTLAVLLLTVVRLVQQYRLRKAAELRAHDEMLESQRVRSIGTIAGGVAHEFNNILTAIFGANYLLGEMMKEQPKGLQEVAIIEKMGKRAAVLVQHLLTFARADFMNRKPLLLNELVRERLDAMRERLAPDIRIETDLCAEPLNMAGDADKLQTMLDHLLLNAADAVAGKADGTIRVSLAVPEKGECRLRNRALRCGRLTVEDNGMGIPPETVPFIYDPFFTTKKVGAGTGLGLSMVYGVVYAHEGKIEVDGNPGEGARFRIYLPLVDERRRGTAPASG